MTLDDIEYSIFQGSKGMEKAIELVTNYVQKKPQFQSTISPMVKQAKDKLSTMSPAFVNQISVTQKYQKYIKQALDFDSNKYYNPIDVIKRLNDIVNHDVNQKILAAKEPATKHNRMVEKNIVLRFFSVNNSSVLTLIDMRNLFHKIKMEINNGSS